MARTISRGMVVVKGATYRIDKTAPHHYSVVRLLDDLEVGRFCTLPALRVHPLHVELETMRDVVRAAMKSGRTSAVMQAAPVFQPDESSDASSRVPSSSPPAPVLA